MNSPCIQLHTVEGAFSLECVSSDGRLHGFPYYHLANYRLEPNPALERTAGAPPERLALSFSTHEVVILGRQLDSLRNLISKTAGITVKPLESRYENLDPKECFVSEITVSPNEG